jgi:predicted heme/steroid binding protein
MKPDTDNLPTYTRSQLALRNGSDREEIWIAYQGLIYEVTPSRHWRTGVHYGHWAGQELSEELPAAPHGEEVFQRMELIGKVKE